ncbi:hypothetical protein [Virgibacillus salexigens]|uniref:Uncharacterized protein n=1 Tax=Virgibacillus massiliensis TaxID=1462526 RepID=A0A024QH22_9BACI|nr:hypothetical protein [Virgibacillus massiliensis]CDQ41814.1 hypothetical protein BN990_04191 [Virgibacillus massiliensis]
MPSQFDKYENLPGVKVEYENGNLYSGQQNINASTKSLLILGTAIDGPVGEPVSVQAIGGPKAAERLFGGMQKKEEIETGDLNPNTGEKITKTVKVPHQGNLIRSMYEALAAGNEDVRLMRISGSRAKTELSVQDIERALEQVLGVSAGNIAFSKAIEVEDAGRLSSTPVSYIREKKQDGTLVKEYTGATAIGNTVLNVDDTIGEETIFFKPNVFRPGHKIEVAFNFNKRTYYEVLRSDPSGSLTQDPTKTNYFSSQHRFFSDDVAAGHTINVYVNGVGVPQLNSKGEWLWRPGREDDSIVDPLKDEYTSLEYEQGGIRFTDAYQTEVENGTYDPLNSSAEVSADYFYYDEAAITATNEHTVPGEDKTYVLNYLPKQEDFKVFYEIGDNQYELTPKSTENPNGDFSMVYPESPSDKAKVVITAGAVPVGIKLKSSYKTTESTDVNPKLVVEGLYAGETYGGLKDILDPDSLQGVSIDIRSDVTANDPSGNEKIIYIIKPTDKRLSIRDEVLEYRTRDLKGIRTINEFANYVNNDANNNIVRLSVPEGGSASVKGLVPTDGQVFLGQKFNEVTEEYDLHIDENKLPDDPARYLWLGSNGFFNVDDLKSMKELYDVLGGIYEIVPGTLDEVKLVVQGIYSKLENYPVDSIVLVEANADTLIGRETYEPNGSIIMVEDPDKNFATQLAQHCAVATAKVWETIGFIGMTPVKNASLLGIQDHIDQLMASDINNHFMYNEGTHDVVLNEENEPIDIGHYVNVVFGPEVGLVNEKLGSYVASGAVIYAALNSLLNPEVSTTNKEISIQGMRYNLSEAQHNQLAGARFVTFEERVTPNGSRQFKVKDGVTAGQPNSDYERLSTVNITHATVQLIRTKSEPFIGLPNGLAQRNSLATEIQAGLDTLKERGVLQDFKFSIYTSSREKVLGNAFITLELVPEFETRRIHTSVALRQSL